MISQDVAIEINVKIVPLTLEIAKHFSRMTTLQGDRDPDSAKGVRRVAWLSTQLKAGQFYSPVWSTVQVSDENNKKYRVDGGHSSQMLTMAGSYFPKDMNVTIREFRAPHIGAARDLYEQFDQARSTRTVADFIKCRAGYVPKLVNISPTAIDVAIRGIAFHLCLHNTNGYDRLDFIPMYPDFIVWSGILTGTRHLQKSGVIGAAFATWAFDETLANEFWTMVREEAGKTKECPTRVLAKFLQDILLDRSIQWPPRALYVKCCHAWNAWRGGRGTSLKYTNGAPLPKLV